MQTITNHVESVAAVTISEKFKALSIIFVEEALYTADYGDATLLTRLYSGRLLYDHNEQKWYIWDGLYWKRDDTNRIRHIVPIQIAYQYDLLVAHLKKQIAELRANGVEGEKIKEVEKKRDDARKRATSLHALAKIESVLKMAQPYFSISGGIPWDSNPMVLGARNGIIDLHSGCLRAGDPSDYVRTITDVNWLGIDTTAPRFEQFMQEIFEGNTEIPPFLQRLFGYGITGRSTEHIFPIFWGAEGRNGKDTLLETLGFVLGPHAGITGKGALIVRDKDDDAPNPDVVALRGKRLIWVSETKQDVNLDVNQVKYITGGGKIHARRLNENPVDFDPTHLLVLITNNKPRVSDTSNPIWDRLMLIPFKWRFIAEPKQKNERLRDENLKDKLFEEASGILAWLVRGCIEWQKNGLAIPQPVKLETANYKNEENLVSQFLKLEAMFVFGGEEAIGVSALYNAFCTFAVDYYPNHKLSRVEFSKEIQKKYQKTRVASGEIFKGITLKILKKEKSKSKPKSKPLSAT